MRFVDLNIEDSENNYEKVLRLGCGPNFIRNRPELFEKMIKEQGLEFWFRFWLTFCFNHGVGEFTEINVLLPGVTSCLLKEIHLNFVEASTSDAINFCWTSIFPTSPQNRRILDVMYQFMEIGFGCALGIVFFKWLVAKEVTTCNIQEAKDYWTIPSHYLDPNFQPGPLEKYCVKQWGNKFVKLLGVSKHQVCWIRKLLVVKGDIETEDDKKVLHSYHMQYCQSQPVRKLVEAWKLKLQCMKNSISVSDELKKVEEIINGVKTAKFKSNLNNMIKADRTSQPPKPAVRPASRAAVSNVSNSKCDFSTDDTDIESTGVHQCARCGISTKVSICQRCEEENWRSPRYYCGVVCQSKDWFLRHEKDHCNYLQRSLLETAKLHQYLQNATKFKNKPFRNSGSSVSCSKK